MKFLLAILFLICPLSTLLLGDDTSSNSILISTASYSGVIFPANMVNLEYDVPTVDGYWTASSADIAALEAALPFYLETQANYFRRDILADLPNYARQYIGFEADGIQYIYLNALCAADDLDWQSEFIMVADGGDCFFQVIYQLDTGEFSNLMVNGEA